MPNKSDNIITELDDQSIGAGPTYNYSILSLDGNRSHASQLQVLFYYTNLGDGTAVSDVTFANWYTPFVLPAVTNSGDVILTFDSTTRTVTIGDTTKVVVTDTGGTSYNLPAFNTGTKVRILRSQNVTNKSQSFGPGSRITHTGLNNAIDQVFDSVQELDTRVNNLEGANFEQGIVLNLADIPVISVEKGGTGATTASAARTALGTNDASNLTTGTINNDRLSNVPVSKLAGTLADSQVAESNVTQYADAVAALTDLNELNDVSAADPIATNSFLVRGASTWDKTTPAGARTALGISAFGTTLIDDADAATARVTLGDVVNSPLVDLSTLTDISAGSVTSIVTLTEAEYADIASPDPNTIYITTGGTTVGTTIQDSYLMLIEAPSDKDYTIDARVAATRTVTNFYAKTSAGTCTATLKNLTDATTIGTISVTSTGGSAASINNATLDENDRVGITISSTSSAADLEMVVEYNQ